MNSSKLAYSLLVLFLVLISMSLSSAQERSKKLPKYTVSTIGDSIDVIDASNKVDGFWIYLPNETKLPVNNVVVFMHGYGAYNPLIFGAWLRHIVSEGNIVIYPRYQKTLYAPKPKKFVDNSLTGIKDAFAILEKLGWDKSLWQELDFVGHSYGGVISMNIAEKREVYDMPNIKNIMICSAGTGPFKAGILDSYENVEGNLIMITSQYDTTVGSKFTKLVESLTPNKKNKVYLHQKSIKASDIKLTSHHNEPYALDEAFDNNVRNYTVKKAFRVGETNVLDTGGYWNLFDQLIQKEEKLIQAIKKDKQWLLSEDYPSAKLEIRTSK